MSPGAYWHVLAGSIAGGITGALVMWERKRAQLAGESAGRRLTVLVVGTAASSCALWAFGRAFGVRSPIYAATAMILITGWAALSHSAMRLPVSVFVLRVRAAEFAILRSPWTGVRPFGAILRGTFLRHLGGRVYLSAAGGDPKVVIQGIYDAEAVHIWALLLCCPWLVWWGVRGWWMSLVAALGVHVLLNVYPILNLRHATWRIEKHIARIGRIKNVQACHWSERGRATSVANASLSSGVRASARLKQTTNYENNRDTENEEG